MPIQQIPLESIAEVEYRIRYERALELRDLLHLPLYQPFVTTICSALSLDPDDLIKRFHKRHQTNGGYFKADEMDTIDVGYGISQIYKIANDRYAKQGYREDLIHLMKRIDKLPIPSYISSNFRGGKRASFRFKILGLEKGTPISESLFKSVSEYIDLLPESQRKRLKAELHMLKDLFLITLLNTVGIVAETDGYFGTD